MLLTTFSSARIDTNVASTPKLSGPYRRVRIGAAATVITWLPAVPPASFSTLSTDGDCGLNLRYRELILCFKSKPTKIIETMSYEAPVEGIKIVVVDE